MRVTLASREIYSRQSINRKVPTAKLDTNWNRVSGNLKHEISASWDDPADPFDSRLIGCQSAENDAVFPTHGALL